MNNFTKYICAGLVIVLLVIQAIMITGLYGNSSGPLNELSDCTNWVIIAALLFTLFRLDRKPGNY